MTPSTANDTRRARAEALIMAAIPNVRIARARRAPSTHVALIVEGEGASVTTEKRILDGVLGLDVAMLDIVREELAEQAREYSGRLRALVVLNDGGGEIIGGVFPPLPRKPHRPFNAKKGPGDAPTSRGPTGVQSDEEEDSREHA